MRLIVPTVAEMAAQGKHVEVLFWVGCAGSFDERAKKITRSFVQILNKAKVNFAVLGTEESCTGDPAKRSGNDFLFQMQAMTNIEILNTYEIRKIVTTCPHCFNTLKNEYPELGGHYEVMHHTSFLQSLLDEQIITIEGGKYKGKRITFHDPCYLGRANGQYAAPREIIKKLEAELIEMKSCKNKSLCCGAGGAQMFKEPENGRKDINIERTEQAIATKAKIIATGCPFCHTMIRDGIQAKKRTSIQIMDLSELIAEDIER